MKKGNFIQKLLTVIILSVYLFATLFSSGFHRHHKGFHHNHSFKKGEKIFDVTDQIHDNDCSVCHFITKKDGQTPLVFSFDFIKIEHFSIIQVVDIQEKPFTEYRLFGLRAPPYFFI